MIRNFSKYLKILHIYGLKSVTVIAVIHDHDNSTLHFTVHIFINRIKSKITGRAWLIRTQLIQSST